MANFYHSLPPKIWWIGQNTLSLNRQTINSLIKSITSMKRCLFLFLFAVLLLSSCKTGYYKEEGKVWYYEWNTLQGNVRTELEDADFDSFDKLKDDYARDKNYVWHGTEKLQGVHAAKFKTLGHEYACDDQWAFLHGDKIEGADGATFKVKSEYLCEDKNDFYWEGYALNVVDKSAFRTFGSPKSYETEWATDGKYVYYLSRNLCQKGRNMLMGDLDSFEPLRPKGENCCYCYARDKNQVYFCDTILVGADPATIELIGWLVVRDAKHVFAGCYQLPDVADAKTLRHLKDDLFSDSLHVYYRDSILEGIDPATFNHWAFVPGEPYDPNAAGQEDA